jgi:hypothetical protein
MRRTLAVGLSTVAVSMAACGGGGSQAASPRSIGSRYPAQVQTLREIDQVASPQTITDLRANPDNQTAASQAEQGLTDPDRPT